MNNRRQIAGIRSGLKKIKKGVEPMGESIIDCLKNSCGARKCTHSLYIAKILSGPNCAAVGDGKDGIHVWVAAKIQKGPYPEVTRKNNLDLNIELEIFEAEAKVVALLVGGGYTERIPDVGEFVVVEFSQPFWGWNPEVPVYWWKHDTSVLEFRREMENFQKR